MRESDNPHLATLTYRGMLRELDIPILEYINPSIEVLKAHTEGLKKPLICYLNQVKKQYMGRNWDKIAKVFSTTK